MSTQERRGNPLEFAVWLKDRGRLGGSDQAAEDPLFTINDIFSRGVLSEGSNCNASFKEAVESLRNMHHLGINLWCPFMPYNQFFNNLADVYYNSALEIAKSIDSAMGYFLKPGEEVKVAR